MEVVYMYKRVDRQARKSENGKLIVKKLHLRTVEANSDATITLPIM